MEIHTNRISIDNRENDWTTTLIHIIYRTKFWMKPLVSQSGEDWIGAIKNIPGLQDRENKFRSQPRENPMARQVRNEYIRRELERHQMNGTEAKFIQELKQKNWWEDFQKWSGE